MTEKVGTIGTKPITTSVEWCHTVIIYRRIEGLYAGFQLFRRPGQTELKHYIYKYNIILLYTGIAA